MAENILKSIDNLATKAQADAKYIKDTTQGIYASVNSLFAKLSSIKSTFNPVVNFGSALSDISSLGVGNEALMKLSTSSALFSLKYGQSAQNYVSSSLNIKTSMKELNDSDLLKVTEASNLLATAINGDSVNVSKYMGTMSGVFSKYAGEIGQANWAQEFAVKSGVAFDLFKGSAPEMNAGFSTIGSAASDAGVSMTEQLAVMGTLTSTMPGAEAGAKYQAMVQGITSAQDKLGISLTDSEGKMLPMEDLLGKLKEKFGDTIDGSEMDVLGEAFGSDKAAAGIAVLMNNAGKLTNSIKTIGAASGMDQLEKQASANIDVWQRLSQGFDTAQSSIKTWKNTSQAALGAWKDGIKIWEQASGLASFASDKWQKSLGGLNIKTQAGKVLTLASNAATSAYTTISTAAGNAAQYFKKGLSVLGSAASTGKSLIISMGKSISQSTIVTKAATFATNLWRGATMLLNAAWLANPVALVIAGIVAGFAGLMAAIPYLTGLWNSFKDTFGDTWWAKAIIAIFDPVMKFLNSLHSGISGLIDKFGSFLGMTKKTKIETVANASDQGSASKVPPVAVLQNAKRSNVPAGGIKQEMNQISNKNNSQVQNNSPVTNNIYGAHSNTTEQMALQV